MTGTDLMALDFDRVLANLAEGSPTLTRACSFEGSPRPWQVLARVKVDPEFAGRYEDATIAGADTVHTEICAIEYGVVKGRVHPSAATAALNSKRWRLERLDRKRWGAKTETDVNVKGELVVQVLKLSEVG